MKIRSYGSLLLAVVSLSGSLFPTHAAIESGAANSGLWLGQASIQWTYNGDSLTVRPAIDQHFMLLDTVQTPRLSRSESAECLDLPETLAMEFNTGLWWQNDSSETVSAAAAHFEVGNGLGSASVDTDDAFQIYGIEVSGISLGSSINAYYDNSANPLFTDLAVYELALNGNVDGAGFGEPSNEDSGVSNWDYLWQNAKYVPIEAVPEPNTVPLLMAGGVLLLARRTLKA